MAEFVRASGQRSSDEMQLGLRHASSALMASVFSGVVWQRARLPDRSAAVGQVIHRHWPSAPLRSDRPNVPSVLLRQRRRRRYRKSRVPGVARTRPAWWLPDSPGGGRFQGNWRRRFPSRVWLPSVRTGQLLPG